LDTALLWLFLILASLQPPAVRYLLEARRRSNLASLSRKRGETVITLIHRQETMSFFGSPVVRFIDAEPGSKRWIFNSRLRRQRGMAVSRAFIRREGRDSNPATSGLTGRRS
jgi:hypothetical protein